MPDLFGQSLGRRDLAARTGRVEGLAGVRLLTLGDGAERGVRVLEFRAGSGLRLAVAVDRAMDIVELEHAGRPLGWHSPTGLRHPGLHEYEGEGGLAFARAFTGFLVTCGLDHALAPAEVPADTYNYPGRRSVRHSLHGRVSFEPARLTGYGERWEGDACVLWAEGTVTQAAMFAENLVLHRRIEVDVGGSEVRLFDRVENAGFLPTPHMFFYHVNLGWPLLDEGSRYLAPIAETVWAAHAERYRDQGVGYRTMPAPIPGFVEQVWEHETKADAEGWVPVALVNDRLALGVEVATRKDQLPCLYQWQDVQAGHYALGIEPSTHHVLGDLAARERGEMIWLGAGEARAYEARFRVLDGAEAIAAAEARIRRIAVQPEDEYPIPSGNFRPLRPQEVSP
jgi:hypothetical protein